MTVESVHLGSEDLRGCAPGCDVRPGGGSWHVPECPKAILVRAGSSERAIEHFITTREDRHPVYKEVVAGRMRHLWRDDPGGIPLCGSWRYYARDGQVGPLPADSTSYALIPRFANEEDRRRRHLCKRCEKLAHG